MVNTSSVSLAILGYNGNDQARNEQVCFRSQDKRASATSLVLEPKMAMDVSPCLLITIIKLAMHCCYSSLVIYHAMHSNLQQSDSEASE